MKKNNNKPLRVELPEEIFNLFEDLSKEHFYKGSERNNDTNAGISRAMHWFEKCDCAILTAWRKNEKTKERNKENNRTLQQTLRRNKYGVIKVRGYYPEIGSNLSREESFFSVNFERSTDEFFSDIRILSETYNQDCFLFKKAGADEKAFLYGTNEEFGKGRREYLGELQIKATPVAYESSTKIGNKWIVFKTILEE